MNNITKEQNDTVNDQGGFNENSPNSISTSNENKDTTKQLPPGIKRIVQKEFRIILHEIQQELTEFVSFVEDIQEKAPSQWEVITVSPLATPPQTSSSISSNDENPKDSQTEDSRSSNAPLRDAFQIVRNLLSKTASLIDKIASTTACNDDSHIDRCSPHYSAYYADYVFQITCFVLQLIGEYVNKFGRTLGEGSMQETLVGLPNADDNVNQNAQNSYLHRKDHSYCTVKNTIVDSQPTVLKDGSEKNQERNNLDVSSYLSESKFVSRITDALELLKLVSEKMLSNLKETGSTAFDLQQELKENFSKVKESKVNREGDFNENELSSLLKEELKKYFSNYSKEASEKSKHLEATLNLIIQSFRKTIDGGEESDSTEFPVKNEMETSNKADENQEGNTEKSLSAEEDEQLDELLEEFVNETYRFAVLSMSDTKGEENTDENVLQSGHKEKTEPDLSQKN